MSESKQPSSKGHAIVMWVIWFAFLQGAFIYQWFLGKGIPEGENIAEPMAVWLWLMCFGPLVVATAIRWLVIPKIKQAQAQLTALIVGLAFSEAPIFFSLFLIGADYPQNQIAVLIVAIFSIIQFAPSYATPGYDYKKAAS
ncbi:MAG: hypothetical protein ACPGGN_05920 [Opitutales bacterium]